MAIVFDPAKDEVNIVKHGLSLSRAVDFEAVTFVPDRRRDYGEARLRAFGLLDGQTCCMVFTVRDGDFRVFSLRRARRKEYRRYVPDPQGLCRPQGR
ncbi:MAG: BrnT family toxin [Caulobacter sp.]